MNGLISVIVPIYRVEEYLCQCIDSIIKQTYHNLEIILVDDGSPDNCGAICDDYAKKDDRIRVIHKKNGGLSDARNVGIDIAQGDYLSFIDSDDYVSEDYIAYLYTLLISNDADMSICGHISFQDGKEIDVQSREVVLRILNQIEFFEGFMYDKYASYAWAKLYKKEIFQRLRYPNTPSEDVAIIHKVVSKSDKIAYKNGAKYFYRVRKNSLSSWYEFSEKKLEFLDINQALCHFVLKKYPQLKSATSSLLARNYCTVLRELYNSHSYNECTEKKLVYNVKKNATLSLKDGHISIKQKICILSVCVHPSIFKLLCRVFKQKSI